MKILDTDHCIALIRGNVNLSPHVLFGETVFVTSISVGELLYGAYRSAKIQKNLDSINNLLEKCIVLSYNEQTARIFSKIKAELERAGIRLDDADLHIASIALHYGAVLVTHNQRHFHRIPNLILEDWLKT